MGSYEQKFIFFDQPFYEDLSKLLILWQKNNPLHLDNKSAVILSYFTNHPVASAYRCFKYMNIEKKVKISYKNVHKKINNLLALGLIERNKIRSNDIGEVPSHGAIYYELSPFGVFYALINFKGKNFLDASLDIIYNHKTFFLYKSLLYPYIQYQTIKNIKLDSIIYALETYLHECAITLGNMFTHLSNPLLGSIVKIGGLLWTSEFTGESVVENFNMGFPLEQIIDDKSKSRKQYTISEEVRKDNGTLLRLSSNDRILYFKLNAGKLQVYQTYEDNLIFETNIDPEQDKDLKKIVNSYTAISINELLETYFRAHFRYDIYISMLKLVAGVTALSSIPEYYDSDVSIDNGIRQDLLLLKNDSNFATTAFTIKAFIDENYSAFQAIE